MKTLRPFLAALLFAAAVASAFASYQNTVSTQGYLGNSTPDTTTTATICGWFKVGATASSSTLLAYNGTNSANGWGFYLQSGNRTVNILAGGVAIQNGPTALVADTWTHLLLVRNGNNLSLAINGVGVFGLTASIITPTGGFRFIGASTDTAPHAIAVADAAYFDRVLTTEETAALAKGVSPRLLRPKYYWPLVRDLNEWMAGASVTITGTGVAEADHPRIYR